MPYPMLERREQTFSQVPVSRNARRWLWRLAAAGAAVAASLLPAVAAGPARGAVGIPPHRAVSASAAESYSMATSSGDVMGFGTFAQNVGPQPSPAVGVAATTDGRGAWVAEADGAVLALGDAVNHGSMAGVHLNRPIVGIAATPDGGGYWLVAADGGVFTFGDAHFYGSTGGIRLNQPMVGMAPTGDGHGYWLVAADGGVFTFGDAHFYGSTGGTHLNRPVVGMAATPGGAGYWLAASDGGIFTFGNAPFYGSGANSGQTVVGMTPELETSYVNPLRGVTGLTPERIDQGVDYAGSGPIYAIGNGVVVNTYNSGWPGGAFISYRLTDGPAEGDVVYVAENVVPAVSVGEQVTPATVLGTLIDAYPDMETGWADPPGYGDTLAMAAGQWSSYDDANDIPTAYGTNFSQLLASLGAPGGLSLAAPVSGTLPAGWPTW